MKVSVIVPVLYGESQLSKTLGRLAALRDRLDLEIMVVVDVPDRRREGDVRAAMDPAAERHGAMVHYRVGERGFGSALRYGFATAAGDVVIPFMGDMSDEPADIPSLVERIEQGWDVVGGSRYMRGGRIVGDTSKQRLSRIYSMLVRAVGGLDIHDVSNAFKAYRRSVVEAVPTVAESFDISVEVTVKAALAGFRLGEIPTVWRNRQAGSSNFRMGREAWNYGRWLLLAARGRGRVARRRAVDAHAPTGTPDR